MSAQICVRLSRNLITLYLCHTTKPAGMEERMKLLNWFDAQVVARTCIDFRSTTCGWQKGRHGTKSLILLELSAG